MVTFLDFLSSPQSIHQFVVQPAIALVKGAAKGAKETIALPKAS